MKSIKPFWWTFGFLLCVYSLDARDSLRYFSYAEGLFREGRFPQAAIAYERAGYYGSGPADRANAMLGKAECLKKLQRFTEAEESLLRIEYGGIGPELAIRAREQTALCGYLAGHFSQAESHLQQLFFYHTDTALTWKVLPLYALILHEHGKWSEAHGKMRTWLSKAVDVRSRRDSLSLALEEQYQPSRYPRMKEVRKAQRWNKILPGAGHAYAGAAGEGLASFGLNLASLSFIGLNLLKGYYYTTFTVGGMLMQMVYSGGIERGGQLAEIHNTRARLQFNQELRAFVLRMYETASGG